MAEWLKAAVLKTAFRSPERGFESLSLRHPISHKPEKRDGEEVP
jgi:hypothetical protein